MSNRSMNRFAPCALAIALLLVSSTALTSTVSAQVAIRGETVHTMTGPPIEDGVVVIRDGKISAVGRAADVVIPEGFEVLRGRVVTPGLIDARSVVGLAGIYNSPHDQDQLEHSAAMQPELRAIDAYNPDEKLVAWLRSFGVTTVHTGHAPGELISGQTMIAKTRGKTVDDAVIVRTAAIAVTLGDGARKEEAGKSPGTRGKMMALLRQRLIEAQEYLESHRRHREKAAEGEDAEKSSPPARDLALEALGRALRKEIPLVIHAHRAHDLANALRLAKEFDLRIWLDGGAEAYLVADAIRLAGVPVIIHPTMARAYGERENLSFETAAKLVKAGIPVALQSGYESYVPKTRVVLFEAGVAAANGLSFSQALATVTRDAAKILGIDQRVGSLAVGKDGDVAIYDGDPFEYTSHCTGVVIEGEVVSRKAR